MSIQQYLDGMKKIQENLLDFLENEENEEENFQNLNSIFADLKIPDDPHMFKSLLYLIAKISNNHHHEQNFFSKIFKILKLFINDIKKNFSNYEIFSIFKGSNRIILFFIDEKVIVIDERIVRKLVSKDRGENLKYFMTEVKQFSEEKWFPKRLFYKRSGDIRMRRRVETKDTYTIDEIPDDFCEKRKRGRDENPIYELIQKDMLKEFIAHINQNVIPPDERLESSTYETNSLLFKRYKISLIEYAAFFGSVQIFKYLHNEGVKLEPSLWKYAVHGKNHEIIHFLKENHVEPYDNSYKEVLKESIKCHHNELANFFLDNFLSKDDKEIQNFVLEQGIKYHNFAFIQSKLINKLSFTSLCQYDYYILVDILLKKFKIDINKKMIF